MKPDTASDRQAGPEPGLRDESMSPYDGGRRSVLATLGATAGLAMLGGAVLVRAQPSAVAAFDTPALSPGGKPLRIGVIGSGRIGGTIGGLWVTAGHPVLFSSRHPEQLKSLVDGLGPNARAGSVAEAIEFGEVLFVAVPYGALPELGKQYGPAMAGKIVLDATNAYTHRDGTAAEEALVDGVAITSARYLRGTRLVRAFNFTSASDFATQHHRKPEPVAVPIAGDDREALAVASQLVRAAGFEPVVIGSLKTADSFAPGGPLFRQVGSAQQLRERAKAVIR